MKNLIFVSIFILFNGSLNAQPLSFSFLGFDPAYCRLFAYQSGNGVVYAEATGGTPPYSYTWENLSTGSSSNNTVWGGLNPGNYKITVVDNVGTILIDTVALDSVSPIAGIEVISAGLIGPFGEYYYGIASVDVQFANTSLNFFNPNDPFEDTTFFWRMTQYSDWIISHDLSSQFYIYNYDGYWSADLVALNDNGCSDTATIRMHIDSDLLELETPTEYENDIFYNAPQKELVLDFRNEVTAKSISVYNAAGQLVLNEILTSNYSKIPLNFGEGIYIYSIELSQPNEFQLGKFVIPN